MIWLLRWPVGIYAFALVVFSFFFHLHLFFDAVRPPSPFGPKQIMSWAVLFRTLNTLLKSLQKEPKPGVWFFCPKVYQRLPILIFISEVIDGIGSVGQSTAMLYSASSTWRGYGNDLSVRSGNESLISDEC